MDLSAIGAVSERTVEAPKTSDGREVGGEFVSCDKCSGRGIIPLEMADAEREQRLADETEQLAEFYADLARMRARLYRRGSAQ
jgi:hypothetical protein